MKYTYENLMEAARYTRISIPNKYFSSKEEMIKDFNKWCSWSNDNLVHHYRTWAETVYNNEKE